MTKQTKHTGIKKLSNGRFQARYFAGFDSQGKRRYPSRTFDLLSDAVKWRATEVSAKNTGRGFEIHRLTVSQYLDQWLASQKQRLRENSHAMYTNTIDSYVRPYIGSLKLSRLRPMHVEMMQTALSAKVSASTIASARTLLSGAMTRAVRLGLIPQNPVALTDGVKREKPDRYPLSVEEALQFIDACANSRFGVYFQFALATGLRPEEGCGLQWPDLE